MRAIGLASRLPILPLHARMREAVQRVGASVRQYVLQCEEAYAAAALYEDLSGFSDAELERRGIGPGDLHRNAFERIDRRRTRDS